MTRLRGRRLPIAVALVLLVAVTAGCLPKQPAGGRETPIRRVLLLGDSLTYGLYSATPRVHEPLHRRMAQRNVELAIDGFPGETPIDPRAGTPSWTDRMRGWVAGFDPDMIVIQSVLFPYVDTPGRQDAYRTAIAELFQVAQSRGAHVYIVSHNVPTDPRSHIEMAVAQSLQSQAAAGRGIETIPLDWWLAHCERPYTWDGWHLAAAGQECHANAIAAAVDQLKGVRG